MKLKALLIALMGAGIVTLIVAIVMIQPRSRSGRDLYWVGDSMRVGDQFVSLVMVPRASAIFSDNRRRYNMGIDLLLRPVTDPRQSKAIQIVDRGEELELRNQAKLIGQDGKRLWVFGRTLVGLDVTTWQKIGNAELSTANPELAGMWMEQSKYYEMDPAGARLKVTVGDGRKFVVDPGTLKVTAYEDPVQRPAKDHAEYQRLNEIYREQMAMFGVGPEKFFFAGERISDGEWMGLLTEEEAREQVGKHWYMPGRVILNGKRRRLYRARLESKEDRGSVEITVIASEPIAKDSYLDAGLMRELRAGKAQRLSGPAGYVVMHRMRLDGTLSLTRIDMSGNKLWEFDTGIMKLDQVLPGADYLGLVSERGDLHSVDLKAGTMLSSDLH